MTAQAGWRVALLVLGALLFGSAAQAAEINWAKSYSSAVMQAKKTGKPIMIDFYADWCGWCKRLDSDVYTDPQVIKSAGQFIAIKLNTETDGRELARQYRVSSLPTILFVNGGGEVEARITGFNPAPQFNQRLIEIAREHRELPGLRARFRSTPTDLASAAALTEILARRGDERGAQQALARVAKLDPRDSRGKYAKSLNAVGDMYAARNQFEEALPLFRRAAQIGRGSTEVSYGHLSIAICHIYQRNLSAATTQLKSILSNPRVESAAKADARKLLARVEDYQKNNRGSM